jgi:hypothetical protein
LIYTRSAIQAWNIETLVTINTSFAFGRYDHAIAATMSFKREWSGKNNYKNVNLDDAEKNHTVASLNQHGTFSFFFKNN